MSSGEHDSFAERLGQAITHCPPLRREAIELQMAEQGLDGGFKGGLARLSGMSGASTLSDMLSGRIPGHRYRAQLAELLGVSLSWLEGGDKDAPEWALLPLQAYERWLRRVRIAWQAWFIDQRGGPSATTAMGFRLNTLRGGFALNESERQSLAERLELTVDDPVIDHLALGHWHAISFPMQLAIAEELGAPAPDDTAHVQAGHAASQQAAQEKDVVLERFRDQYRRLYLPPQAFQLTRLALVSLLHQREYQGKDGIGVRDALELLWRQHLLRDERESPQPPPEMVEETGRQEWTPLDTLLDRCAGNPQADHGDGPYRSLLP